MDIGRLVNRPQMYVFEDGVGELAIGFMSLVSFGAFSSLVFRTLPLLVPQAIWLGMCLGVFWGAKKLKERVTYPRGGYVALDEQTVTIRGRISGRALNVALLFGMFGFIVVFSRVFKFPASQAVVVSAIFFGAYTLSAIMYRIPHMLWLAAFSALVGVWVYGWNYSRGDSLAFVILSQGVALVVDGGVRLWRFLKSHPRPIETEA
jgi:hypothetical protein